MVSRFEYLQSFSHYQWFKMPKLCKCQNTAAGGETILTAMDEIKVVICYFCPVNE